MFTFDNRSVTALQSLIEDRCAELEDRVDQLDVAGAIELYAQLEDLVNA